jgi:hypothetical protein
MPRWVAHELSPLFSSSPSTPCVYAGRTPDQNHRPKSSLPLHSMTALRARLRGRGTDSDSAIQNRLAMCLKEVEYAKEPNAHDIVIVNDDLDRAYEAFRNVALGAKIEGDILPLLED